MSFGTEYTIWLCRRAGKMFRISFYCNWNVNASVSLFNTSSVRAGTLVSLCAARWQPACLLLAFKLQQVNWDDTLTGFLL